VLEDILEETANNLYNYTGNLWAVLSYSSYSCSLCRLSFQAMVKVAL